MRPKKRGVIETETWRIVMDIQTNGATKNKTALLVVHIEEIIKKYGHVCNGISIVTGSVSDIENTGVSKW